MTSYTLLHFGVASLCLLLGAIHFAIWLGLRSQRIQLLLAGSFVGFALLNFGVGGSSFAAEGALGSTTPWIFLGLLAGVTPAILVPVAPLTFDAPVTRRHQHLIALLLIIAVVWIVGEGSIVVAAANEGHPLVWEQVLDTPSWIMWLFWLGFWAAAGLWLVDAARALRRSPLSAVLIAVTSVLAALTSAREMLLVLGLAHGPSHIGLAGLPLLVFSSASTARAFMRAMHASEESAGLGRYRMIRALGKGGMGELMLAARLGESGFTRYVAIKRILRSVAPADAAAQDRFLAEARMSAKLRHPNIVAVYDLGRAPDGWFIIMEYLAGKSLAELRAAFRDHFDIRAVAAICQQVGRGLAHAHRNGIVHRDVSPHNVMVSFEGMVRVVDFGVAKGALEATPDIPGRERTTSAEITRAGLIIGKRPYLAPEQLHGKSSTSLSDQWALGVVLSECLTGQRPFDRDSESATFEAIISATPSWPRALRPEVPEALDAVVQRALSKSPAERFADCDELATALANAVAPLPPIDLASWMRTSFPDGYEAERALESGDERAPSRTEPGPPGNVPTKSVASDGGVETVPHRRPR